MKTRYYGIPLDIIIYFKDVSSTYGHRVWRTGLPVRSAALKPIIVRSQFAMRPEL
jgi:hypothetical protein